ncbi:MAG: toprim domain-containing protein [Pyrinomonadaceae bacterium]|nr:toprim domain-containing protein [Pyrinomonadaceae bacterium]
MNTQYLSFSDLENFDPRSPNRGKERRFACPICGQNKPIDAPHRSMAVNTENGSYFCHRCQAKGRLKEFWESRPITPKKQQTRQKINAQFSLTGKPELKEEQKSENLAEKMAKFQSEFLHSPAEMYLLNRSISTEVAIKAGCGYTGSWEHWEKSGEKWILKGTDRRVVFPIYDVSGNLVAFHGRAIDSEHFASPKITRGDKSNGIFLSDANIFQKEVIAVCEGAIDAMALAVSGIPAVAMTGTTPPDWFYRKMAFRKVLIATDADEAGDRSAYKLRLELQARGAKTLRLRPKNAKDWGETLEKVGITEFQKFMLVFTNISDDDRVEIALQLARSGREEVAEFVANLIDNINLKTELLLEIRFNQTKIA